MATAGEHYAGAALRASKAMNTEGDRIVADVVEAMQPVMKEAIREGVEAALTDEVAERFWTKGMEVLQQQAAERTGIFVLGGIKKFVGKAFWITVGVIVLYSIGGWGALKAAWLSIKG